MIPLWLNLERVEQIQDAKSYWHRHLCQRGACIICDLRRVFRGKAFMCGHYDRKPHQWGRCESCSRLAEFNPQRRERENTRNRERFQRYYTDPEWAERYRERKRVQMRERYQNHPEYRQAYNERRAARARAKRAAEGKKSRKRNNAQRQEAHP